MQEQDREPIIAICLLAALADGERTPEEREQFARITERLGGADVSELVGRVQRGELTAAEAARRLTSREARRTAYEMAIAMIYADGEPNPRERDFLSELKRAMELSDDGLDGMQQEAESLARAPLAGPTPAASAPPPHQSTPRPSQAGIPAVSHDAALDSMIRQQALLAGALELLPQNLAAVAIIPVQLRLVYRIGADYGQKLDAAQIRDLLGVLGIGAAGQVLDSVARRILGGLGRGMFGRVLGGVMGGTAGMVAGAGVSFVTTYALGQAAKQYYAQGRRLSQADLRELFVRFRAEAEALLPRVQQEIHAQSRHLDLGRVLASIRGVAPAG
ncbi:MAG TPA: TerB family tellurite resistance protein [Gemmatimonadales bacterium]|jgi:uncharacterized protein (DUF697 family)/tellurite resistance protein|nr:TerB family tellurite resistance protein [Gemmatimonadales bacterium]